MNPNLFSRSKTIFQNFKYRFSHLRNQSTPTDSNWITRLTQSESFHSLRKGIFLGFGFMLGMFGTGVMAVDVPGTIKTWSPNDKLSANDLNTAFTSLRTPIVNIPDWTKAANGTDAYYTAGRVRNNGISSNAAGALINLGVNDGSNNNFGGTYTSGDQGGYLSFDSRSGQSLFSIWGRQAGVSSYGSQILTLSSAGNLSVSGSLHLVGSGQATANVSTSSNLGSAIVLQDSGGSPLNGGLILFGAAQGNFAGIKGLLASGDGNSAGFLSFSTRNSTADANLTERLRITDIGNVGIRTTSPSYTLHVNGSIAGTSAYNNLSDGRYKENIQNIFGALDKIERLRGVSYTWKQKENKELNFKEGRDLGFIGQEVEKIIPEAVSKDEKGILSLAYFNMIPVVVEAIKELRRNQNEKIEELSIRLSSVTEENKELKKQLTELKKENADFKLSVMQHLKALEENRYAKK